MPEFQHVVDNIRGFLSSTNQTNSESLRTWAADYARSCSDANDRLRRCAEYLHKGLRSEAIHLAEQPPSLLDVVASLDLPESQEWAQICFQYELPQPQPLLLEAATALNEAYAEAQPLDALLAHHRLLALAHAPLEKRLGVMRKLGAMDPLGPFWDEDIRQYERARLEEVRASIHELARDANFAAACRLEEEVDAPVWREPVPLELKRAVHDTAARLRRTSAETEPRKLLPALHDAHGAMAFDETRLLLGQWMAIATSAQLTVPPDLKEQIDPISAWVAQQQRLRQMEAEFEQTCKRLSDVVEGGGSEGELDEAYKALHRLGRDIPVPLGEAYAARVQSLAAARNRRRKIFYTAAAAALLLAAGTSAFFIYQNFRAREVSAVQAALRQIQSEVEKGNPDSATPLVKQLLDQHRRVAGDTAVARTVGDVTQAVDAERERAADFRSQLKVASDAGAEKPDVHALQRAMSLAKTPEEVRLVSQLRNKIAESADAQQRERDTQFGSDVAALLSQVNGTLTASLLEANPQAYADKLSSIQQDADRLAQRPQVTPALHKAQVESLGSVLLQKQSQLASLELERSLLQKLELATTPESRAAALAEYVEKCPDSPRTPDFRVVISTMGAEKAVESLAGIQAAWGDDGVPRGYAEAEVRAKLFRQYVKDFPPSQFRPAASAQDYLDYLELGLKAAANDGPWKKSFRQLLDNPLIHDLKYLETAAGRRYYVMPDCFVQLQRINEQVVSYTFDAVTSPDISRKSHTILKVPPGLRSESPTDSPQALFAAGAVRRIADLDFRDWDVVGVQMVADLVASHDMNPVLRGLLVQNALASNQSISDWIGDPACPQVLRELVSLNLDDVPWLDPNKPVPTRLDEDLNKFVAALPSTRQMGELIQKKRDSILRSLPGRVNADGILIKGASPLHMRSSAQAGALAYVLSDHGELTEIARAEGGDWKVDDPRLTGIRDGSTVFVRAPR